MRLWLAAVAVILPALATRLHAQPLTGQATVIDGDTIEIHRQRIRLSGIDALESDQLSRYSKGDYAAAQSEAKKAERGVWQGNYVMPWDYRACRRDGGQAEDCSDWREVY